MSISCIVLAKNEERNIRFCLDSVDWCDEVIVIDSQSEDRTVTIAEREGARVIHEESSGNFDALRNKGLEQAENDWIFVLDADEICPPQLAEKLKELNSKSDADAFRIPRLNYVRGKEARYESWPDYQLRFYRKETVKYKNVLHDILDLDPEADMEDLPAKKSLAIHHFSKTTLKRRVSKINRYTSIRAENQDAKGLPRVFYESMRGFGKKFVYKKGFLDGYEGFMESLMPFFIGFLKEFKKWEIKHHGDERQIWAQIDDKRKRLKEEGYQENVR